MGNLKSYLTVWKLLKMSPEELQEYFKNYKPGDTLTVPGGYHKVDIKINCPETYIHSGELRHYWGNKVLKKSGTINVNVDIKYKNDTDSLDIIPRRVDLQNPYRHIIVRYNEYGKLISLYDSERTSEPSE